MYQSILVPVDGSAHSHNAVALAAELIDDPDGRLHLLNVQSSPVAGDVLGRGAGAPGEMDEAAQSEGERVLESTLQKTDVARDRVEYGVKTGAPAATILREAKRQGVDAIVIGSRGASHIASMILGSVAYRVLHAAECRVVLVR